MILCSSASSLLDDRELDLLGVVPLGEDLHGVDAGQQDAPELALLRRLETHVATVDLEWNCTLG